MRGRSGHMERNAADRTAQVNCPIVWLRKIFYIAGSGIKSSCRPDVPHKASRSLETPAVERCELFADLQDPAKWPFFFCHAKQNVILVICSES